FAHRRGDSASGVRDLQTVHGRWAICALICFPMERLSPEARSSLMRRVGVAGTLPERRVRDALVALGFNPAANVRSLPGTPDLVRERRRAAVFVQGCFWHGCERCDRGRRNPLTNRVFGEKKVITNRRRDRRAAKQLRSSGWHVISLWECQTRD